MWESLIRWHKGPLRLYALCLDKHAADILAQVVPGDIVVISLDELERADKALLEAKATRTKVEYYFTLTPCLVAYLLQRDPSIDLLTYLDADLYFYSTPEPLYGEMEKSSVLIIPHRFPERLRHLEENGRYNVGWVSFRNNEVGRDCVQWWRLRCLEWCHDYHDGDRFADQKYLDCWPSRFIGVHVCEHVGANVAPWNVESYRIATASGSVTVNGVPLLFYHFQGYRWLNRRLLDPGIAVYNALSAPEAVRAIMMPYAKAVATMSGIVSARRGPVGSGNTRWADGSGYSLMYQCRMVMEGRALFLALSRFWYLRSPVLDKLVGMWDRLLGRG